MQIDKYKRGNVLHIKLIGCGIATRLRHMREPKVSFLCLSSWPQSKAQLNMLLTATSCYAASEHRVAFTRGLSSETECSRGQRSPKPFSSLHQKHTVLLNPHIAKMYFKHFTLHQTNEVALSCFSFFFLFLVMYIWSEIFFYI